MALKATTALLTAQFRSTWNRILRDAGLAGAIATWASLLIVAAVLLLPSLLMLRIGRDLGAEIAASADTGVLRNWNGIITVLTVAFAFLGSFRQRPSFPFARFGHHPVTPLDLLLADVPSSLFEVFPLLAATGVLFLNAGLATRMSGSIPLLALLTLACIIWLLSLMILLSALWSALTRRRVLLALLGASVLAVPALFGLERFRLLLRSGLPAFSESLPLSHGYAGLVALRSGDAAAGWRGIAVATVTAVVLLALAAVAQHRRLLAETGGSGILAARERTLRFTTPAAAMGSLFLRQLLARNRLQIILPLLYSAPFAIVSGATSMTASSEAFSPEMVATMVKAQTLPLYAIVAFLAIAMNSRLWMNQFGWERGGIRSFLLLPIEPGAILEGRLRGLAAFVAIQTAIAALPLLWLRAPTLNELGLALGAGGVALVVTTAIGHAVSVRFPRVVEGAGGGQLPLHLSWIPFATMPVLVGGLAGLYAMGELAVRGAGTGMLLVAFAGTAAGYRALLPRLGNVLDAHRERLASM